MRDTTIDIRRNADTEAGREQAAEMASTVRMPPTGDD